MTSKITRRKFCTSLAAAGTTLGFSNGFGPLIKSVGAARHQTTLTFVSPYKSNYLFAPTAQAMFKDTLERLTEGEIFVDLIDKERGGASSGQLLGQVARNHAQGGIISLANLSRYSPVVDAVNIPFWSADHQSYINLVTSQAWKDTVLFQAHRKGIRILYHCLVGPRTLATTWNYGPALMTPDRMKDLIVRIPSSKVLAHFYLLMQAKTKRIEWGQTANAASKGLLEALDPAVLALYSGPGNIKDQLASITKIDSVHDSWVAIINQDWLRALPAHLYEKVEEAAEISFVASMKECKRGELFAEQSFKKIGVDIFTPTAEQKQEWITAAGHERKEWNYWKEKLVGSVSQFNRLIDASQEKTSYDYANV
ncbi:hypothetical protein RYZ26_13590 [Terasakiella sp. A23]|uniref:TRAP transporter substrate-binding protein n=1 Tax=Terasakiella sp. FCG-A23 TaxID=3080561 RepID=UPI002952BDA5|nr:hypothetical protein [Terasakiella sp. A23]MDV7340634.1 hypothetical protein [Terasakiella sp. A23]